MTKAACHGFSCTINCCSKFGNVDGIAQQSLTWKCHLQDFELICYWHIVTDGNCVKTTCEFSVGEYY